MTLAASSDVLSDGLVAVAVTNSPAATTAPSVALIGVLPEASVVTLVKPR